MLIAVVSIIPCLAYGFTQLETYQQRQVSSDQFSVLNTASANNLFDCSNMCLQTTGCTSFMFEDTTCQTGSYDETIPPGSGASAINLHEHIVPEWQPWSAWRPCSVTCAGGTESRVRICDLPNPKYHNNCTGDAMEIQDCNTQPCPSLVVATFGGSQVSGWNYIQSSDFSACPTDPALPKHPLTTTDSEGVKEHGLSISKDLTWIVTCGGVVNGQSDAPIDSCYSFDLKEYPVPSTWTPLPSLTVANRRHSLVQSKGRVISAGGFSKDILQLDQSGTQWNKIAELSTERQFLSLLSIQDEETILFIGGMDGDTATSTEIVLTLDLTNPGTGLNPISNFPDKVYKTSCIRKGDLHVYCFNGLTGNNQPSKNIWRLQIPASPVLGWGNWETLLVEPPTTELLPQVWLNLDSVYYLSQSLGNIYTWTLDDSTGFSIGSANAGASFGPPNGLPLMLNVIQCA